MGWFKLGNRATIGHLLGTKVVLVCLFLALASWGARDLFGSQQTTDAFLGAQGDISIEDFSRLESEVEERGIIRTSVFERIPEIKELCEDVMLDDSVCRDVPVVFMSATDMIRFLGTKGTRGLFYGPRFTHGRLMREFPYLRRFIRQTFGFPGIIANRENIMDTQNELLLLAHEYSHYLYTYAEEKIAVAYLPTNPSVMQSYPIEVIFEKEQNRYEGGRVGYMIEKYPTLETMRDRLQKTIIPKYGGIDQEFSYLQEIRLFRRHPETRDLTFDDYICLRAETDPMAQRAKRAGAPREDYCYPETTSLLSFETRRILWERVTEELNASALGRE